MKICFLYCHHISNLIWICWQGSSFLLIIGIEIAILAHSFCIIHLISVWTFIRKRCSTIQVITMIAHTFCIVLHLYMLTSSNCSYLSCSSLDNSIWIRCWFLRWCLLYFLWISLNLVLCKLDILLQLCFVIFQFVFLHSFIFVLF